VFNISPCRSAVLFGPRHEMCRKCVNGFPETVLFGRGFTSLFARPDFAISIVEPDAGGLKGYATFILFPQLKTISFPFA